MQEKAKEPEIRFAGFTGAWEQRKLGDVLEFLKDGTHGTHPDADQGSLLLSAKNIKNGDVTWDDTDRKISQAEFDMIHSNFKLKKGDVLLTIVGSIGESAILKDPHEITFQRSVAFLRPNKTITSGFLYSEIQGEKFQTELNNRKSTSAQPGIYLGDLSEIPLDTPPNLKEQEEIGKFFSEINSLLTLHQRKYEKLLNIKKSMLEKMFPKEGEVVPEIRFKGFTGAWEQRKLGELYEKAGSGGTPNASNASFYSGTIPFLGISDIKGRYITKTAKHISEKGLKSSAAWMVPSGAISLAMYASVGKVGITTVELATSQAFYNMVFASSSLRNFIFSRLEKSSDNDEWLPLVSTGTQSNLNADKIKNWCISVPNPDEQKLVGDFFKTLDSLLTLHQRQSENAESRSAFGDRQGHSGALCRGRSDRRCAWRRSSRLERCD